MSDVWRPSAHIPPGKCFYCGFPINTVGVMDGKVCFPKPNDFVVCLNCGAVMANAEDLSLRLLTDEEIAEIRADPHARRVIAAAIHKVKGNKN